MAIKIAIEHDPAIRGTKIYIYNEKPDGSIEIFKPVTLEAESLEPAEEAQPTLTFDRRMGDVFLREFANALIVAGYKPDEIKSHDKQVEAIKYHLEDMRRLVFKK